VGLVGNFIADNLVYLIYLLNFIFIPGRAHLLVAFSLRQIVHSKALYDLIIKINELWSLKVITLSYNAR
jgi:hypothetical protein